MIVETHHVEVHIFDSVFLEYALRPDQLTQIEVVQQPCLRQCKELSVI